MTDTYIDQDETQLYGPHASKYIRSHVLGLVAACDPALTYFADEIDHATTEVGKQVKAARKADAGLRKGAKDKRSPLETGKKLLGRFSKFLDTLPAAVDRKVFFPQDGTAGGVGKSGGRVLLALTTIQAELADADGTLTPEDASRWLAEFTAAQTDLTPALETADAATTGRQKLTPAVEAAREAWLVTYRSARDVVTGVLRQAGRLDLLKRIFYDLAVPSGTKIETIPDVPPPAPPATSDPSEDG